MTEKLSWRTRFRGNATIIRLNALIATEVTVVEVLF